MNAPKGTQPQWVAGVVSGCCPARRDGLLMAAPVQPHVCTDPCGECGGGCGLGHAPGCPAPALQQWQVARARAAWLDDQVRLLLQVGMTQRSIALRYGVSRGRISQRAQRAERRHASRLRRLRHTVAILQSWGPEVLQ